uniref:Cyclin-like domain-containing protein n=1 Tax=Mola mola TaxID=94237 RepID=A0A3Q3X2U3_MOLML
MSVSLWCEEMEDEQGQEQGWAKLRAPWDPNVSGRRVIQRLLRAEEQVPGGPGAAVCCQRGCDEAVFPLSVSLLDRFLAASLSPPVSPHCLAAGCILIASKLTEGDGVTAEALCAAAGCSFLPSSLREMERLILATLRWDTAAVTPQDFLPHFLASLEERGGAAGGGGSEGAPPSLVAAASLDCALRGLGAEAPGQLAELCQAEPAVLQCYSEMIEHALRQRLGSVLRQGPTQKGEELERERPGTPTDMRDIDF